MACYIINSRLIPENFLCVQNIPAKVTVLCVQSNSVYKDYPSYFDPWDKVRDAYNYSGSGPVIAHAPCAQWSKLSVMKNVKFNLREKELAFFCLEKVQKNGGIFEHPSGSSFFKIAGIKPTISVNQHWFGFPARKTTYLYFKDCRPVEYPLCFDIPTCKVESLGTHSRSRTTVEFAFWLYSSIMNDSSYMDRSNIMTLPNTSY